MTHDLADVLSEYLPAGGWVEAPLAERPTGSADGVRLLDGELSAAGAHAETLLAEAARVLRPGGLLAAVAHNRIHAAALRADLREARSYSSVEFRRLLEQRGFTVELLCAPGAAALLRGDRAVLDVQLDRQPGLLDAAPRLLSVARSARDESDRSDRYLASLPLKVVAAAVLCRDEAGRVLVVYDTYKQGWTIPGGVVDADELPRTAAERETWEEAGVRVHTGDLLGVFAGSWPDRVLLVYDARPAEAGSGASAPAPLHPHEIGDAAWVDVDEALRRVRPATRFQMQRCLAEPGGTWRG